MIRGFREFVLRGNVVDLAVAVVLGVAFGAVVTSFTEKLINPLIAALGGDNVNGLAVTLVAGNAKSVMDFGAVISAGINFLIVAAVIYFVLVVPMNAVQARRRRGEPEAEPVPPPEDIALLTEIRDLLRARNGQI